jgi:hypothetical protein
MTDKEPLDLSQFDGHTPEPWTLVPPSARGDEPIVVRGHEGGFMVKGLSPEREVADARLIAAGPKLLAEVKRLREEVSQLRARAMNTTQAYPTDLHSKIGAKRYQRQEA